MEQAIKEVRELMSYYIGKADTLTLPEECVFAEELADKIWHLEETLEILKDFHHDG